MSNSIWRVVLAITWLLLAEVTSIRGERLPVTVMTAAHGLGHDHVRCAVRDAYDLMWFCTAVGLTRFDGVEFTSYGPGDGLPSASVNDLVVSPGGHYEVATDRGLYRFDVGKKADGTLRFTAVPGIGGCDGTPVYGLELDSQGRLWAGCDQGLFRLEQGDRGVELVPVAVNGLSGRVSALEADADGNLWVGGLDTLLHVTPGAPATSWRLPFERGPVRKLLLDAGGSLWVGLQHGLGRLETTAAGLAGAETRIVPSHSGEIDQARKTVRSLFQDRNGTIWVGAVGALYALGDGVDRTFTTAQGLRDETINAMAEDRSGHLWLGTDVGGVARWMPDGLVTFTEKDGLEHPSIGALIAGRDGRLYASSDARAGLSRLDGDHFTGSAPRFPAVIETLLRQGPSQVVQDLDGVWWFATAYGLFRFPSTDAIEDLEKTTPRRFGLADGLPSDFVLFTYPDSDGDLWIVTIDGSTGSLVRRRRQDESFEVMGPDVGLPVGGHPASLFEGPPKILWVGWSDGSLLRFDGERFAQTGLRADAEIWDLLADDQGILWVATHGDGVYRIDRPMSDLPLGWRRYDVAQGLASSVARSLTSDRWGRIYVAGVQGVDRLDPATGGVRHFTPADGLAQLEVTSAITDAQGALWFGTWNGLSRLVPRLEPAALPSEVRISALRVDGREIPVSAVGTRQLGPLRLAPGPHSIDVSFFAVDFAPGEGARYRYRLAGRDWSAPTSERHLVFAEISPGDHTIEIATVVKGVDAGFTPARVTVVVALPLWRRAWFFCLIAVVVGAAVVAAHRARVRRALVLERVRTRIAADLHDDVGAALARISMLAEAARIQKDPGGPAAPISEDLGEIARSARELISRAREIVWSLNPRYDDLGSFIVRLREIAAELLEPFQVTWTLSAPDEASARYVRLRPEARQHLLLVFKEAMHNVVRHAGAQQVELGVSVAAGKLVGIIRDDGQGRDDDALSAMTGNGLVNMGERIAALGGDLMVDRSSSGGVKIRFEVPVGRTARPFWRRIFTAREGAMPP